MKNPMWIVLCMGLLGAGLVLAPIAHAGWLPDGLVGSPDKLSKERQALEVKKSDDAKAKAVKKHRAEAQQIYLTRDFIKRTNRQRHTVIGAPDYAASTANRPAGKGKKS